MTQPMIVELHKEELTGDPDQDHEWLNVPKAIPALQGPGIASYQIVDVGTPRQRVMIIGALDSLPTPVRVLETFGDGDADHVVLSVEKPALDSLPQGVTVYGTAYPDDDLLIVCLPATA